jgi:hypothetical protein
MDESQKEALLKSIAAYNYPAVAYDFVLAREVEFRSMRELDRHLCGLLRSTDTGQVKDALSSIVYWGNYHAGYRMRRVKRFRDEVDDGQLRAASGAFPTLSGTGLQQLKSLGLPQFSNMAFLTKLRTFLDPDHFCVLDSKIATLAPLAARLKLYPTCIPVTASNDTVYTWWVDACRSLACQLGPGVRPVDVERGIFHLVANGGRADADRILSSIQ